MKTALTMTAAVLALAMAAPVYAETAQDVPGSSVEGYLGKDENPGALTAPEKDKSDISPNANSAAPDTGAANVPGSSAEGNQSPDQNEGSLSSPEKNKAAGKRAQGGMSDDSPANVPGANADGDSSSENQGALSAPEKDKM
jgi:hypothetical protein